MTAHELIEALFAAGDWGKSEDIPRLEDKIREAVIEEASVCAVHIQSDGTGYFDIKGDDDTDVPDGFFDLILKEAPGERPY